MVADGRVRKEDKDGNDAADIAAEFGRLRQPAVVIDARRNLLRVKGERCPCVRTLHRFRVAMSRETLRHAVNVVLRWTPLFGIMAFGHIVRNVDSGVIADLAFWLALPGFIHCMWHTHDSDLLSANDVGRWLYSVVLLVQFTASFLSYPRCLMEKTTWASMGSPLLNFFFSSRFGF